MFRVNAQYPIGVPPRGSGQGLMALSLAEPENGAAVYSRGVPENVIYRSMLVQDSFGWPTHLEGLEPILTRKDFPKTADGYEVVGYEDPTALSSESNPFEPGQAGFLCTQTYRVPDQPGKLFTNLVYSRQLVLKTVLTPLRAQKDGLAPFVDMVKESIIYHHSLFQVFCLFEYGDGRASTIGSGVLFEATSRLTQLRPFYTAKQDRSEHVSTVGDPIALSDGRKLLFFNRRRDSEWGITWMLPSLTRLTSDWEVNPNWVIRGPRDQGVGPGGQLIAFGSCVYQNPIDPNQVIVLYHVNDNSCWCAVLEYTG